MMKDDDFKLLKGFALGRTNGQTFAIVESLSRLKTFRQYYETSRITLESSSKWEAG